MMVLAKRNDFLYEKEIYLKDRNSVNAYFINSINYSLNKSFIGNSGSKSTFKAEKLEVVRKC